MVEPLAEMLGAEGVSRGLVRMLRSRVPKHLARQRAQRGIPLAQLPDIPAEHMFPTPQPFASIEKYPCLMVVMEQTEGERSNRQEEPSGSYDELVLQYRVQLHVYTLGPAYSKTELMAQRYVLAARSAAISGRSFGDMAAGQWGEVLVDRLREGYTDPLPAQDGTGFLSGGWVEFYVRTHERLWTDDAWDGTQPVVDTVAADVGPLAAVAVHPALADEPGW